MPVQEDHGRDAALKRGLDVRQFGGMHFDRNLAHGVALRQTPAQLGNDLRRGVAKMHLARLAQRDAIVRIAHQRRRFIGDERPSAPRAGVRQTALARARFAAQQHAPAIARHAAGVNARRQVGLPRQYLNNRVQKEVADKFVVARRGRREPRERKPAIEIADREIVLVRLHGQQVPLRSPDQAGCARGLLVVRHRHANIHGRALEERGKPAPTLLGRLHNLARVGLQTHFTAQRMEDDRERQLDAVLKRVEKGGDHQGFFHGVFIITINGA